VSPRRHLLLLAGVLAVLLLVVSPAGARSRHSHHHHHLSLQFLGQAIIPTGTTFAGTEVGGLSSITYDRRRHVYYALSDDQSQIDPARFYTVRIHVGRHFDASDVRFKAVTTLQQPGGGPYPTGGLDPEGLVLTKDRKLILTSEGNTNTLLPPFLRRYDLRGDYLSDLPVPGYYQPTADQSSGIRFNLAFESAGVTPDGRSFFTATENALFQDGPAATPANGSPSRLLRYNLRSGRLVREYVYETDPIFQPPVPPTQFAVNGVVELLPFSNEFMLSMERSFSVGVPGTGNEIKLYTVAVPGATNVLGVPSLAGHSVRPVRKKLLFDLGSLGIPLDNVEGMTWGPRLPDGRRSLVLVSDNNFAASQFTQFLLFAFPR
jgi:3-phytase/alkaline phosphatase D